MPEDRSIRRLLGLRRGALEGRRNRAERILFELLPQARRQALEKLGIQIMAPCVPSLKNPELGFILYNCSRSSRHINCCVGTRKLWFSPPGEYKCVELTGMMQIREEIEVALRWLLSEKRQEEAVVSTAP